MVKNSRVFRRKLGRTSSHRLALLRNMLTALVTHERIKTTLPKAKELRSYADKIITASKYDTPGARGKVYGALTTPDALAKMPGLAARYQARPGGYTRVIRAGFRAGDHAPMAVIELVDREGELRPARPVPGAMHLEPESERA